MRSLKLIYDYNAMQNYLCHHEQKKKSSIVNSSRAPARKATSRGEQHFSLFLPCACAWINVNNWYSAVPCSGIFSVAKKSNGKRILQRNVIPSSTYWLQHTVWTRETFRAGPQENKRVCPKAHTLVPRARAEATPRQHPQEGNYIQERLVYYLLLLKFLEQERLDRIRRNGRLWQGSSLHEGYSQALWGSKRQSWRE